MNRIYEHYHLYEDDPSCYYLIQLWADPESNCYYVQVLDNRGVVIPCESIFDYEEALHAYASAINEYGKVAV